MKPLLLIFVLKKHTLYLIIKNEVLQFYLLNYDFDVRKEVSPGKGNHLLKNNGPINDINKAIKERLSRKERFFNTPFFSGKEAIFISDKPLDNFEIKHFIDFTEQMSVNKMRVFYDNRMDSSDMLQYARDFVRDIATKDLIGGAPPYFYKGKDNSIEMGELKRVNL